MSRIFIGNLPPDVSVDEICTLFCSFGCIVDVCIKKPARHSAFAFVRFSCAESAVASVRCRDVVLSEQILRLEIAREQGIDDPKRTLRRMIDTAAMSLDMSLSDAQRLLPGYSGEESMTPSPTTDPRETHTSSQNGITTIRWPLPRARVVSDATASLDMRLSDVRKRLPEFFPWRFRDMEPRVLTAPSVQRRRLDRTLSRIARGAEGGLQWRGEGASIVRALPGQPAHDPGDFPSNIRSWIWWHEHPGSARLLCQLDGGLFAFLAVQEEAHCSGCACSCCGWIRHTWCGWCSNRRYFRPGVALYLAPRPAALVARAMAAADYRAYMRHTDPVPHWACHRAAWRVALAMAAHRRLGAAAPRWAGEAARQADVMAAVWRLAEEEELEEGYRDETDEEDPVDDADIFAAEGWEPIDPEWGPEEDSGWPRL
jgi:hypothetical protein